MTQVLSLYGGSYIARDISEGEELPIGTTYCDPNSCILRMRADFSELKDLFANAAIRFAEKLNGDFSKAATGLSDKVSRKTFPYLYVMQQILDEFASPKITTDIELRRALFREEKTVNFSKLMTEGQMACTEIALFSVKILSERNLPVHYVSAAIVEDDPFQCENETKNPLHAFLFVDQPDNDNVLIYDPARPILTYEQQHIVEYPSICAIPKEKFQLWLETARANIAHMRVAEELTGTVKYFGPVPYNPAFYM